MTRRLLPTVGLWAFIAGVGVAAVALFSLTIVPLAALPAVVHAPWWALLPAFLVAELSVVRLQFGRNAFIFTMKDVPFVVALAFGDPRALVLTYVVGGALAAGIRRNQPWVKFVLNTALSGLEGTVAVLVFRVFEAAPAPIHAGLWLGALVAMLSSKAISIVVVMGAISLRESRVHVAGLRESAATLAWTGANTSIGLLAVIVLWYEPIGAVLVVPPAGLIALGYRSYTSERAQRRRVALLYDTAQLLAGSTQIETMLFTVLSNAREALSAGFAEITLTPSADRTTALRVTIGGLAGEPRIDTIPFATADRAFLGQLSRNVATTVPGNDPRLGYRRAGGSGPAAVAVLDGGVGGSGWLLLADRLGEHTDWTDEDCVLLQAVAVQIATSLEKNRLTKSVARLAQDQEDLRHQASHDALTGLGNRMHFAERSQRALHEGKCPAVLFVDLDDFKMINDRYGHGAGDRLLAMVAARMRACLRGDDTAVRLGGDEFAILLSHATTADAVLVAERLLESLRRPFDFLPGEPPVGASIGIVSSEGLDLSDQTLIEYADAAMYAAKRSGKGTYALYRADDPAPAPAGPP